MREFFKNIILNLYIYCGNRQAEKMTDDELKMLLDALCRVSVLYNYISEDDQKKIIEACLLSDKEYQNLNARVVSKWLETNGKKYFKEVAHIPGQLNAEPVEGEAREKWLELWKKELAKVETNFIAHEIKGSGSRLRESIEGPKEPSALEQHLLDQEKEKLNS